MSLGFVRARRWSLWALLAGLVLALAGGACGSKKRRPPAKKKAAQTKKLPGEGLAEETAAAPGYIYSPIGKRDPFKSYYKIIKGPTKEAPGGILTKFEIDQLKLTAIISGISKPRAQVELPDGKGVVVKVGTRIGKNYGRVVRIKNDEVVVAEDYRDWSGRKVTNYIKMRINKKVGEE